MVTDSEQKVAEAFRASDYAPTGEWWSGFPLGFELESGNIREADGVCITSRSPDGPDMDARTESRDWFREQRESGWLDEEHVTLVEVKSSGGTWRALGQLIVYRELFEMDWNATVDDLIIVADASVPGKDSEELFHHHLDESDLFVHDDGEFR